MAGIICVWLDVSSQYKKIYEPYSDIIVHAIKQIKAIYTWYKIPTSEMVDILRRDIFISKIVIRDKYYDFSLSKIPYVDKYTFVIFP